MLWFRSHHGAPFDSKLAVVAKRANVTLSNATITRGHAASVWWAVLDYASQQNDRGSVAGIDPEEVAAAYEYDEEQVRAILDAMRKGGLLIDQNERLTGWDKRQVNKEDDTAAERQARYRASRSVTPSNAASRSVTKSNALDSDLEEDKKRGDKKVLSVPSPKPVNKNSSSSSKANFHKPINGKNGNGNGHVLAISQDAMDRAKELAPRYDIYFLEKQFKQFNRGKEVRSVDAAFVGFVRKHVEKNPL